MDYRALAELVMMSMFGLSTLVFAAGLSIRLFLAPTLRDLFGRRGNPEVESMLSSQLMRIEKRLDGIEGSLERLDTAAEFDRRLNAPKLT